MDALLFRSVAVVVDEFTISVTIEFTYGIIENPAMAF
jgi:hypothetical protein